MKKHLLFFFNSLGLLIQLFFGDKNEIDLKRFNRFLKHCARTHFLYEFFLTRFDPKLKGIGIMATSKEFIGRGNGNGAFNVYRKIRTANGSLFEKIYFKSAPSLRRNVFLSENVFDELLAENIVGPKIIHKIEGEFFVVLYFEYYAKKNIDLDKLFGMSTRLSHFLMNKFGTFPFDKEFFQKDSIYAYSKRLLAEKILHDEKSLEIYFRSIDYYFENIRSIKQHCDLKPDNSSFPNVIYDWDRFKLKPIGYDIGYSLANLFLHSEFTIEKFLKLVEESYEPFSKAVDYDTFSKVVGHFFILFHVFFNPTLSNTQLLAYVETHVKSMVQREVA